MLKFLYFFSNLNAKDMVLFRRCLFFSLGVSLHWIRYSTLTDIRMSSGERVASAYAGHGDQSGGITGLYTRATFEELRAAHRHLFGSGVRRADRACSGGASCI